MEAAVVELDAEVSDGSTAPVVVLEVEHVLALAPGTLTLTGFCSVGYWSWNTKHNNGGGRD